MTHANARRILIPAAVCVGLLGVLLVLTANLDDLILQPGQPWSRAQPGQRIDPTAGRGSLAVDVRFLRHVLFLAFTISLAIVLVGALFTKLLRKWLYFTVGLFGALIVFDLFASKLPFAGTGGPEEVMRPYVIAPVTEPGTSDWTRVAIAVGLSVGTGAALALGSGWIASRWRAARDRRGDRGSAWELELLAQRTLSAGRDTNLVLRCYHEMLDLLSQREHVAHAALTPREFADRLRALGLRSEPIDRLTALFELVRYGHRRSDPLSESAVATLKEIRSSDRPISREGGRE